ncbi:MAG: MobC family plasmid mobilization relaxosome protein [archaeon]|nr:MobC family plasmid mobilization relaxosome protein [archaeon]
MKKENNNLIKAEKNKRINLRLSELEMKIIEENMKATGYKNLSSYARKMMMDGKVEVTASKVDDKLIYEVNKIGNNINQIAKQINETKKCRAEETIFLKQQMKDLWKLLSKNL